MPIIYKIHDIALRNCTAQSIYDGVLQDGILYKLDGEVKMQLREIPYWGHDWHQYEYNLCVISFGEQFGYADIESRQIIHQPCWEDAMPFYGGRVKENGKFGFIDDCGNIVIQPKFDTLDFVWFNFQVQWREDKAAATVIKGGKEVVIFNGSTIMTEDMTVYPMYLSAKRKSR